MVRMMGLGRSVEDEVLLFTRCVSVRVFAVARLDERRNVTVSSRRLIFTTQRGELWACPSMLCSCCSYEVIFANVVPHK